MVVGVLLRILSRLATSLDTAHHRELEKHASISSLPIGSYGMWRNSISTTGSLECYALNCYPPILPIKRNQSRYREEIKCWLSTTSDCRTRSSSIAHQASQITNRDRLTFETAHIGGLLHLFCPLLQRKINIPRTSGLRNEVTHELARLSLDLSDMELHFNQHECYLLWIWIQYVSLHYERELLSDFLIKTLFNPLQRQLMISSDYHRTEFWGPLNIYFRNMRWKP